jgi:hypothetical protein
MQHRSSKCVYIGSPLKEIFSFLLLTKKARPHDMLVANRVLNDITASSSKAYLQGHADCRPVSIASSAFVTTLTHSPVP